MRISERARQYVKAGLVALTPGRHRPEWIDWHPAPMVEGSFVVFTAADSLYFRKFGPAFLSSLVRQHPSVNVHFHLFDPDMDTLEILRQWQARLPSATIGHSRERLPMRALRIPGKAHAKQSWKSLYICCSRFLAAQHLQRRCAASVLLMDIDVLFASRVDAMFAGADCGLMPRLDQKNWCKRTLGGVVFASSSPLGRAFLDHACLHIRKFLTLGLYWFAFDQYALYRALRYTRQRDGLARFRALTPNHVSFDVSASAPILYPKGKRKDAAAFNLLANDAIVAGQP